MRCEYALARSGTAGRIPLHARPTWTFTPLLPNVFVVPVQAAAVELLAALAPAAERWGRWCVFGAQAAVVYGVPRLSADVVTPTL
jgi:hypothetical protein